MANVVPISKIPDILILHTLSTAETSVLTRATRRNILEYAILHPVLKSTTVHNFAI
jgi:hypothetical protein